MFYSDSRYIMNHSLHSRMILQYLFHCVFTVHCELLLCYLAEAPALEINTPVSNNAL